MLRPVSPPSAAALVAMLAFALPSPAQLDDWSSFPVVSPGTVRLEQNLVVVPDGRSVHAWSAQTRQWSSMTATWTVMPAVNIRNEHCLVQDGPVFWGYSPRTGAFAAKLAISGTPTVAPIGSPQTWHDVVVDGNVVHAFFAISGHWETYTFSSAPTITNGGFCFLITAAGNVFGVSSFHGSLVPLGVANATVVGAYGNMGIAESIGTTYGFSASRNTWTSHMTAASVMVSTGNSQPAFVRLDDGMQILFFSGNTGAFTAVPAPLGSQVTLGRAVAVVVDGSVAYGYSAFFENAAAATFAAPPAVSAQQYQALLDDGTGVTGFSAARGVFSAPLPGAALSRTTVTAQVALAEDPGGDPVAVYSSFLNEWTPVPAVGPGVTSHVSAGSVILELPGGGLWGNSMRTASWHFQPTPPLNFASVGTSPPQLASTFVAEANNTLYAFNPLVQEWRSVQTAAPASLRRAHHHVILCGDGVNAYAFSHWTDRWAARPVSGPLTAGNANVQVQSAYVLDGGQILAYSGVGQLSLVPEFPHYYRAATRGSLLRLDMSGEPGSPSVLGVSPAGTNIPLGSAGTLRIEPNALFLLAQPVMPASGTFTLSIQIPSDPALSGQDFHFQGAVVGPNGVYLTNAVVATVL